MKTVLALSLFVFRLFHQHIRQINLLVFIFLKNFKSFHHFSKTRLQCLFIIRSERVIVPDILKKSNKIATFFAFSEKVWYYFIIKEFYIVKRKGV